MKRDNLPWLGLALLLLVGGWIISQRAIAGTPADPRETETFRAWLWGTRSLDLAVQVGIVFVGALGIAALLPSEDDPPPQAEAVPEGVMPPLEGAMQAKPTPLFRASDRDESAETDPSASGELPSDSEEAT